jgi:hypothetical protein
MLRISSSGAASAPASGDAVLVFIAINGPRKKVRAPSTGARSGERDCGLV